MLFPTHSRSFWLWLAPLLESEAVTPDGDRGQDSEEDKCDELANSNDGFRAFGREHVQRRKLLEGLHDEV